MARLKFYLFILVVLFVLLDSFGALDNQVFFGGIQTMDGFRGVFVNENHVKCEVDFDCELIEYRCDNCGCGQPVNKKYVDEYSSELKEVCSLFKDEYCDPSICPEGDIRCVDSRCWFVAA
tara:strand:- start:1430 stop:1789 length:360 start_codon:yes stop_codon:yes gene_type:complete